MNFSTLILLIVACALCYLVGWNVRDALALREAEQWQRDAEAWQQADAREDAERERLYHEQNQQYQQENHTALQQIAKLRRQIPGRDKSGRFVKRSEFTNHGSE